MTWYERFVNHPSNPILLISGGILFVLLLLVVWHGWNPSPNWEEKAKTAIHTADSIRVVNEVAVKVVDSLHKAAEQKTVEIKTLTKKADSLRTFAVTRRESIERRFDSLPDTCKAVVKEALEGTHAAETAMSMMSHALQEAEERDVLRVAEIDTLRTALLRTTKSNADLTEEVRAALRREKLFGVVPMPSRTASFFIGAAAGAVAAAYITRH